MTKILRCPECGATGDSLHVEKDAVVICAVEPDPSDPYGDGIKTLERYTSTLDGWRIVCDECAEEGEGSDWLDGWLVDDEEEDDDDD